MASDENRDNQAPIDPGAVAADTAALAANSAERAAAAAQDAITNAQTVTAGVTAQAAEEMRSTEERLAEWQTGMSTRIEESAADLHAKQQALEERLAARMDETMALLSSIQERLPRPQESPTSPDHDPSDATLQEAEEQPPTPEEPKPARRRAHRWI